MNEEKGEKEGWMRKLSASQIETEDSNCTKRK